MIFFNTIVFLLYIKFSHRVKLPWVIKTKHWLGFPNVCILIRNNSFWTLLVPNIHIYSYIMYFCSKRNFIRLKLKQRQLSKALNSGNYLKSFTHALWLLVALARPSFICSKQTKNKDTNSPPPKKKQKQKQKKNKQTNKQTQKNPRKQQQK